MRFKPHVGVRNLICQGCDKPFEANRSDAKWCEDCRWARSRAASNKPRPERLAPPIQHRICIRCSKPFTQKRNRKSGLCWECRAPGQYDQCPNCGSQKLVTSKRCKNCHSAALPHIRAKKGSKNAAWKGGRILGNDGYWRVRTERPDRRTPYELEHRVLWEKANGPLPRGHIIHHLNGIKSDNRLENLVAMSRADHHTKHADPYEEKIRALEARIRELEGHP